MAAASYTEDLTDLDLGEANTNWVELSGTATLTLGSETFNAQGAPAGADGDYPYIQGSFSVTQDCTKNTAVGSLAVNNGAGTGGHGTDGAYLAWQNYMVASNIETYANDGFMMAVGNTASDFKIWTVGGVDKAPYPYGGWVNHAVNTSVTADFTAGTPNATEQYIGACVYVKTGSSKGEVHNVDAIRYGRCSAIFEHGDLTNGYATFDGFATQNDLNANRWGLIQSFAGGYLWKGRMSIGTATNATDFRDSSVKINIQWTPKVTANFNLIEVLNTSTNIAWTDIVFTCLDTTTASKGRFLMTDNATVALTDCAFNDMDTFVFLSNATVLRTPFVRCGVVTTGGGSFTNCTFDSPTGTSAALSANLSELTTCSFTSDGSSHAVELTTIGTGTMTWNGTTTGFDTGATGSPVTPTSTGNETIYVNVVTASDLTINVAAGATVPSIRVGASFTGSVNVLAGQVTAEWEVLDESDNSAIQDAAVTIKVGDTVGGLPFEDSVTITRSVNTATVSHTAHGLATGKKVLIEGADQNEYNRIKTITVVNANSYTYEVLGSPTTPATGTITATAVIADGVTDVNGKISDTRSYSVDQSFTGLVQKGTGLTVYKQRVTSGTISSANGISQTILLSKD